MLGEPADTGVAFTDCMKDLVGGSLKEVSDDRQGLASDDLGTGSQRSKITFFRPVLPRRGGEDLSYDPARARQAQAGPKRCAGEPDAGHPRVERAGH